uniref:NADH dehydrogenase [ubiquinone] 1 beta subcomplex subunit 4 n=1 Tax=Parastrongyloides trichosuri TaxID=131310 RepID=A0A0N4Z5K9_PARTI
MRVGLRLLRPAANQNVKSPKLWQDPTFGYFETHGKTEFLPGEQYNLSDEEKKAVLWRYRVKEILKKEYLRKTYNPEEMKHRHGVVMDPSMFRWYSADMNQAEYFRATPRTVFLYVGGTLLGFYLYTRLILTSSEKSGESCTKGDLLWWDRQNGRLSQTAGSGHFAPTIGIEY